MGEEDGKKPGCLGRLFKGCIACLVLAVLAVAAVLAAMPLWVGPVAKSIAEIVVPEITGTAFSVRAVEVNPYTGRVHVEGVQLANPEGYQAKDCFRLESLDVGIELGSLSDGLLHVRNVDLVGPYASYQSHKGTNNVDAILAHANRVLKFDETQDAAEKAPSETAEGDDSEPLKLRIDRLSVKDTKLQVANLPVEVPVPNVALENIGDEKEGSSFDDVAETLKKSFGKVGDVTSSAAGVVTDAVSGGAALATDGVKKVGEGLKDGGKATVDAVGTGAKAVGEGLATGGKATVDAVGTGAKAVGDGIKGGANALKNLFK